MKKLFYTAFALTITVSVFAQKSDGTTRSLVNAEKDFEKTVAKFGDKEAFLKHSSSTCLVFRPNPVSAKTFYTTRPRGIDKVTLEPNLTRVSRSGDLGFTTGNSSVLTGQRKYGQYLSIWKVENNSWKLVLDINTSNNKPLNKITEEFLEPKDHYVPKYINKNEIKAGKEIILTTEKTLNTMLKTYGIAAFSGFLAPNARLIFPGNEAINGTDNILHFYNGMVSKMSLKTIGVDKALGSDLAYTYGVATIDYNTDFRESFNYVFIYEKGADSAWNLIVHAFTPAER